MGSTFSWLVIYVACVLTFCLELLVFCMPFLRCCCCCCCFLFVCCVRFNVLQISAYVLQGFHRLIDICCAGDEFNELEQFMKKYEASSAVLAQEFLELKDIVKHMNDKRTRESEALREP